MQTDSTNRGGIVSLHEHSARHPSVTGGKGANLAELSRAGFAVPSAVCVTVGVYEQITAEESLSRLIDELTAVEAAGTDRMQELAGRIREEMTERELPAETQAGLVDLIDDNAAYAVRSSATAEDLPGASFAGQHDTFLHVRGVHAVSRAVVRCMASLFTDRAVSYRAARGIPHDEAAMAVVIQTMVPADASGVLFTADPSSGKRTVASIDATPGTGEGLVSGTVTGDHLLVDRRTGDIIESSAGHAGCAVHSCTGSGVLDAEQVDELCSCGGHIEELFAAPQDIEWSFAGDRLWILQSRPITTLLPLPEPQPEDEGLHVYYSWNHRQGMTEVMPPLVVDYWLMTISSVFDRLGLNPSSPMGTTAGGLVYLDLTALIRSPRLAPRLLAALEDFDMQAIPLLEQVMQRDPEELAGVSLLRGLSIRQTLGSAARFSFSALRSIGALLEGLVGSRYEYAARRSREWADDFGRRMRGRINAGDSVQERVDLSLRESSDFLLEALRPTLMLSNIWFFRALLGRLCPRGQEADFAALERGLGDNVTTTMMMELGDVADVAREHPRVESAILSGAGLADIRGLDGGPEFLSAFRHFMDRYGFRAAAEIEMSHPRYCEDPSAILSSVRASLRAGKRREHRRHLERLEAEAAAAVRRLEQSVAGGWFGSLRQWLVRSFALRYRGYLSMREVLKYALSQLLAETRRQILEAGELLARENCLREADDVWLYRRSELQRALADPGDPPPVDLQERRRQYERHRRLNAPRVMLSDGEIPRPEASPLRAEEGFSGIATSGGTVEGRVRIIYRPGDASLEPGEILVAPHTDPGWTPLFLHARGLITSVGGVMTHGSLVAREYGIPSVVLADATEILTDGQRVRLDGDAGLVIPLHDGAPRAEAEL